MDGNQSDSDDIQQPNTNKESSKNGSLPAENAPDKKKNKPEDITIVKNGHQQGEDSLFSPVDLLRNYGGMQATELLLSKPAEEESPPQLSFRNKVFDMPPSGDHEPKDTCSSAESKILDNGAPVLPIEQDETECKMTEDVQTEKLQHEAEGDHKKENGVSQEMNSHWSDHAEKEVPTSEDAIPSLPTVPESEHVEETAIEVDDGTSSEEVSPKLTERQQTSRDAIFDELQSQFDSDSIEDEEYRETCCRKCIDDCCSQSCTCIFGNPFSSGDKKGGVKKETPMLTETLRKGKAEGLRDFKKAIFPLIPDFLRIIWVIFELTIIIVGLVLSVISFSLDQNEIFNIIHLVLICISTLLALIDGLFTFKNSKVLRKLCCKCKAERENEEDKEDEDEGCCEKCYSRCSNLFDVMRLILSEVIFYPLLICDIFELIIGRGFEGKSPGDIIGIVLFAISLLLMILTVYVARIVVLIGMVKNATAVRTPDPKMIQEDAQQEESVYDSRIRQSALWYQVFFCVHVVLQMLAQLLMYIAIAAKIRYDNRHFYEAGNTDESIHVSGNLGFMIFSGFIMPACGLFTFFIATYYWSQQYPIGYRIDMMSIFKMTEYGMLDLFNMKEVVQEKAEKMRKHIHDRVEGKKAQIVLDKLLSIGLKPLKKDFDELFNKSWLDKFLFPFKTPTLVIICLIYAVFQLAFVLCAAQTVNEMGEIVTQILNGGGWVIYYIVTVIIGVIANLYVFIVAGFWMLIIALIIAAIAVIIACVMLLCLCAFADCDSPRPQNY